MNAGPRIPRLGMTLSERLTRQEGWVYMTGMQALVRLPLQQARRDRAAGLRTGGFISGYRGSPLGTYDMNLWAAADELAAHDIVFRPGVNEDIAATAAWGAQQIGLFPGARFDGVFAIWYGKAPGVDRSMDALRHANLGGTSDKGGTLLLVGDDHGAKSSTVACSSDFNFVSAGIPLLAPATPQEVLDFGLHGIAMSRHTGTLVAMKLVTDVVEGGGSVHVGPDSPAIRMPPAPPRTMPAPYRPWLEQERSLWTERLARAKDYARVNGIDRISGAANARLGIVAVGKSWQDLEQTLATMGWRDGRLGNLPLRLYKPALVWPLDEQSLREFARGLDTVIVVEEKRPLVEDQIRAALYGGAHMPRIVGKTFDGSFHAAGGAETAFSAVGELTPAMIRRVITRVALETDPGCGLSLPNSDAARPVLPAPAPRQPTFCAGCPHGRSTQVVEGSRALAGIGCHTLAMMRDPAQTNSVSHMGGEGAMWIGQQPFTDEPHVFANMGDGTYFHSGLLAIRGAVAAGVPMTYKLLYNGFVSMTGGQVVDGDLTPERMAAQLLAEGVTRIAVVTDDPDKYAGKTLGKGVTLHPRTEMEQVQLDLRVMPGVTAIIYDQPCATERRRQRKRGTWPDPDLRVYIDPEVCEGCGDCSKVSGCMAIEPLETELGRKRVINQSSCNKDLSCLEGFCPSLVTVRGARLRKAAYAGQDIDVAHLPLPAIPEITGSWAIVASGIGGTGVVTMGQTLAVAAHAAGYYASNLDITGLAQKYGSVHSHVKFAAAPALRGATRVAAGEADALIGADLIVAAGAEALSLVNPDSAVAVTDLTVVPTLEFARDPDWQLDGAAQFSRLQGTLGQRARGIEAQALAERLLGDRVFANMLLVGAAWQQGGIPLPLEAIHRAIELNGVQVAQNMRAFDLGRLALAEPETATRLSGAQIDHGKRAEPTLDALIADRRQRLADYGGARLADRYSQRLDRLRAAGLDATAVRAAARGYYKLLAVKDEWEIARLYTRPGFTQGLRDTFDGDLDLVFHFGAWPLGRVDKVTGKPVKRGIGGRRAMMLFGLLNRLRPLRGSLLDPFRHNAEARLARDLRADYEADMDLAATHAGHPDVAALLDLPDQIRGYGHVRAAHAQAAGARRAALRSAIGGM